MTWIQTRVSLNPKAVVLTIGRPEDGTVHIRFENPNDERDTYLEAHQLQFVARKAQEIANA